jgi:hypothetical protein
LREVHVALAPNGCGGRILWRWVEILGREREGRDFLLKIQITRERFVEVVFERVVRFNFILKLSTRFLSIN